MKLSLLILTLLTAFLLAPVAALHAADPICVLEQQPQQTQGYGDKFLGETIAAHLEKQPGLSGKNAKLDDAEQGPSDAALDAADGWRRKSDHEGTCCSVLACILLRSSRCRWPETHRRAGETTGASPMTFP